MCVNQKYVNNRYTGARLLVPCGKCNACLQEKANRSVARIHNHQPDDSVCLFVTLTYSNAFVPYCLVSDLKDMQQFCLNDGRRDFYYKYYIPIYRNQKCRWYGKVLNVEDGPFVVGSICSDDVSDKFLTSSKFPELTKARNCVGFAFYEDIQLFYKRLRQILKRNYNDEQQITYFSVSEYGGRYHRPHYHLLLYVKANSMSYIRSAIAKAWPFGDVSRSDKRIQVSRNAAGYVASYTNSSASIPSVFQINHLKPQKSHSFRFGHSHPSFGLDNLLSAAKQRDLTYTCQIKVNGVPSNVDVPIPKYIINRYFPKFVSYSGLSYAEVLDVLRFSEQRRQLFRSHAMSILPPDGLSFEDNFKKLLHQYETRLNHCYAYYHSVTGNNYEDYCIDFVNIWSCHFNTCLKFLHSQNIPLSDFYENISDFLDKLPSSLPSDIVYQVDPNSRVDIVNKTFNLSDLFLKKDKTKKVTGYILSSIYDDL